MRQAAWRRKATPSFSDTLALVRQHRWPATTFCMSTENPDLVKIPRALLAHLTSTLAFAA